MATSQLRLERAAAICGLTLAPTLCKETIPYILLKGGEKQDAIHCIAKKKKEEVQQFPRSFISNISSTTLRLHANAEEDFWPFQDVTEFYEKIWKRLIWITKC